MPRYTEVFRRRAKALADNLDEAQRLAKGVGLFFVANQQIPRASFMILSSWTLEEVGKRSQALADDPPDYDYDHRTMRRPRRIRYEEIESSAEGDEVARKAVALSVAADDAGSAMSAHLRAFERFQGAAARNDDRARRLRGEEAVDYARQTSRELVTLAYALSNLRMRLSDLDLRAASVSGVRTAKDLRADVLSLLYLAGLPIPTLESLLRQRATAPAPLGVLDEAADAAHALAAAFETWMPPEGQTTEGR